MTTAQSSNILRESQAFSEAPSFRQDAPSFTAKTQDAYLAGGQGNPPMTLVEIQRQRNARRLGLEKPHAPAEKLHQLSKTRQEARQAQEEQKKKTEEEVLYSFQPEINSRSKKIMANNEESYLDRTYNWNDKREEKRVERVEAKQEEAEKDVKTATAQLSFVNDKVFAVSRVKVFVEGYKNLNATNSFKRDAYHTHQTRNLTPTANKLEYTSRLNKSQEVRPIMTAKKEVLINFLNLIKKDKDGNAADKLNERLQFEGDKQKRIEKTGKSVPQNMPLKDFREALHAHLQA